MESITPLIVEGLKEQMQKQNVNVSELSERAGLSESTVNAILNLQDSNPFFETIGQLILALDLTISEFFVHPRFNGY